MDILQLLKGFSIFKDIIEPKENMAFVYSPYYNLKLQGHVFPATKFERIFNLVSLDDELSRIEVFYPDEIDRKTLELVHTVEYIDDLLDKKITDRTRFSELPLNYDIVNSFLFGAAGTVLATELTDKFPFVFNIGGGYHHCYPDHAEGFCYLNDVAIAVRSYQLKNPDHKILIIDLDVHQGNGNAVVFNEDPNVFTFSMHQESLYPKKEISKFDIPLPDRCSTTEYISLLCSSLEKIKESYKPDLIYYLAGADPFEDDIIGGLNVTKEGLFERDRIVKKFAKEMNAKTVIVTAGGYSRDFKDTILIHLNTAKAFYRV